jgi:hypothetical protein
VVQVRTPSPAAPVNIIPSQEAVEYSGFSLPNRFFPSGPKARNRTTADKAMKYQLNIQAKLSVVKAKAACRIFPKASGLVITTALKTTVKISGGKKVQPLTVEKIEALAGFCISFFISSLIY